MQYKIYKDMAEKFKRIDRAIKGKLMKIEVRRFDKSVTF